MRGREGAGREDGPTESRRWAGREEHIGPNSNNTNESFLLESSDTLNADILGLSKQRLKYSESLIIGHLNTNSVRNKFSTLQQTVLNKTDILLLSETNRKDRTKTGGGLLLYVNESLPCKIINSYKFKENFGIMLFEFRQLYYYWAIIDLSHKMISHLSAN